MGSPEQVVDLEKFNSEVRGWAAVTESLMESGIAVDTGATKASVGRKYKRRGGSYERISFPFARTGIYIETGAGRGHGGRKGSVWYTKKGQRRSTDPNSFGLMGLGLKKEKPWINPAFDAQLPQLNIIVTSYYANASVRAISVNLNIK